MNTVTIIPTPTGTLAVTIVGVVNIGNGGLTPSQQHKLDGIQAEATKNSTDEFLLERDNHTGEQAQDTVTGLPESLDSKLNSTTESPAVGWRDMTGQITVRGQGDANPSWTAFQGAIFAYEFPSNSTKEFWQSFHIDHDYCPGSPLLLHVHCATGDSVAVGTVKWYMDYTVAKGHGQGELSQFSAPIEVTSEITTNGLPYQHYVAEIAIEDAPDTLKMEPDSLVLVRFRRVSTDPGTFTGSVWAFQADGHYQYDRYGTVNRQPDFYTPIVEPDPIP